MLVRTASNECRILTIEAGPSNAAVMSSHEGLNAKITSAGARAFIDHAMVGSALRYLRMDAQQKYIPSAQTVSTEKASESRCVVRQIIRI